MATQKPVSSAPVLKPQQAPPTPSGPVKAPAAAPPPQQSPDAILQGAMAAPAPPPVMGQAPTPNEIVQRTEALMSQAGTAPGPYQQYVSGYEQQLGPQREASAKLLRSGTGTAPPASPDLELARLREERVRLGMETDPMLREQRIIQQRQLEEAAREQQENQARMGLIQQLGIPAEQAAAMTTPQLLQMRQHAMYMRELYGGY